MKNKKIISIFAITILVISLVLNLCSKEWHSFSFWGAIIGVIGSVIAIIIPNKYILKFDCNKWTKENDGYYIIVKRRTHEMGKNPKTEVFMYNNKDKNYELIITDISNNEYGDVYIYSRERFIGKVIIN